MYKIEKSILAALVLGVLVVSEGAAQTIKKTAKPATTTKSASAVKKAPGSAVKASTSSSVLKSKVDSLSAAIGVSFASSLQSQGINDINTEILNKTVNATLKGEKTTF